MTQHLPAELAAAYVRELSADVRGVAVVGEHAEPASLAGPAEALTRLLDHGSVRLEEGLVVVAGARVVVAAGRDALPGPTSLDAAAALAALESRPPDAPPESIAQPSAEVEAAVRAVLAAT